MSMTRTPNSDCQACGGDGVDADLHGMFDYDCVAPCPQCWTDVERNTARDDGTRRTRAMVAACEGISTEALEAGVIHDLRDVLTQAADIMDDQIGEDFPDLMADIRTVLTLAWGDV